MEMQMTTKRPPPSHLDRRTKVGKENGARHDDEIARQCLRGARSSLTDDQYAAALQLIKTALSNTRQSVNPILPAPPTQEE
jgi:hypothetical protein